MNGGREQREQIVSVAELARVLRRATETSSSGFWVEGEVASLKRAPSGHAYFTLKDEAEDALVECVAYRFNAMRARRYLQDGVRLLLRGKATVWAPRGRLQFIVDDVRPAGRGALLEALEKLKARLHAEGLFAPARKRKLPEHPHVVGVVTSAVGAAFHDIRTVAFRRSGVRIVLCSALVQGDGAPESIVRAIDLIEQYPGLDVLIVGRGGGSGEDLMAFNDERVVRRVAGSRVPVVSAVGHEIDLTLTDLAADVRAATPSQAAELVIPDARARLETLRRCRAALIRTMRSRLARERSSVERLRAKISDPRFAIVARQQELDELNSRLQVRLRRLLVKRRSEIELLNRRLLSRHPRTVLAEARAEFEPLWVRLRAVLNLPLERARSELSDAATRLNGLSPLTILGRGYAIAHGKDGRPLLAAEEAEINDPIRVRLAHGMLRARVIEVLPEDSEAGSES